MNDTFEDPDAATGLRHPTEGSIKLLVVEDNEADLDRIKENLSEAAHDFEIFSASQVEDALQLMHSFEFGAVLLDLSLPPEGRGLDTFKRAQVAASAIPIVVMTARHDEKLALQAVRAGAQDYLVKGKWDAQLLIRTILYAVERHRMLMELQEARRHQQFLASHDRLTGLTNRGAFEDQLQQILAYAQRHDRHIGLFFLDLDGFKDVNDGLGHSAGDEVLKEVARRLVNSLRKSDLAARLGGDEFMVMIQDVERGDAAAKCAERLILLLAAPHKVGNQDLRLSTSIGIAIFPDDGAGPDELMRAADISMYQAKSRGKNQYEFFSKALSDEASRKLQLETNLRRALENEEFLLHYQPIVDAKTRRLVRAEALIRWMDPERGLVSAREFIPSAEESGLIEPIGDWVLGTACKQWQSWQAQGLRNVPIAVNLSTRQLLSKSLVKSVVNHLAEAKMSPSCLELELTETTIMQHSETSVGVLLELHALGIGISLDDFGTAYSSLSRLQALPIDSVKIDRSFVREIPNNPDSVALTAAIISLTHNLGLKVVAEGVEADDQLDVLVRLSCDEVQGYLFSPALPAEELARWIDGSADTDSHPRSGATPSGSSADSV